MIEALIGAAATVAVGVLAWVQWAISRRVEARQKDAERQSHERQRQEDQQIEERRRDIEMGRWGADVIHLMAELETACAPIAEGSTQSSPDVERLGHRASALVDEGRLFFRNIPKGNEADKEEGTRVKLLDEVLRACYVARHIAAYGFGNGAALRGQVWQSRRRFVKLLQKEMGSSLRQMGADSAGEHIPHDPTEWPSPAKPLRLPKR